jgi:ribonuclease P protein component
MRKNLTKRERLNRKADIDRIFREGRAVSVSGARLRCIPNGLPYNRIVIIPVRKYGGAVERNRLKRQVRECYRQEKSNCITGYDIAVLFYPGRAYDYWERKDQLLLLFAKAGLKAER